jgi:hypothetical protein
MFEENPKRLGTVFIMATPSPSVFFVILCCWYHFVLSVSTNPKPTPQMLQKELQGFFPSTEKALYVQILLAC